MTRNTFIEMLHRDDPKELLEYISNKGKKKSVSPFISFEDIPDSSTDITNINNLNNKED